MQYSEMILEKEESLVEKKKKDYLVRLEEITDWGKTKGIKNEGDFTLRIDLNKENISLFDRKR